MLPAGLTAKISMQQDQDSLAHTVFLTVNAAGEVISGRRCHSLIRVSQRLDYTEVQTFLDRGEVPERWLEKTPACLTMLAECVRKMRKYRELTEEFIELPIPEVRVICDEKKNQVIGIERRLPGESEQLIEECMLAANQFVGKEMPQRSVAGIYRVHPEPEAEKSIEFSEMMHTAFDLPAGDIANRKYCREFISSLPEDQNKTLILNMILRSMARASYAVRGDLHFALGKTFYAHFTSPIRRYTDLKVHQQLWALDSGQRTRGAGALEHIAEYCSDTEENIDAAFFTANDRLKVRILEEAREKDPGRKYECTVTRILNSGIQVELPEYALYAFVPNGCLRNRAADLRIGTVIPLRFDDLSFQTR
jgi:ribonuclease R